MFKILQDYSPFDINLSDWWYGKQPLDVIQLEETESRHAVANAEDSLGSLPEKLDITTSENLKEDVVETAEPGLLNKTHCMNVVLRHNIVENSKLLDSSDGFYTPDFTCSETEDITIPVPLSKSKSESVTQMFFQPLLSSSNAATAECHGQKRHGKLRSYKSNYSSNEYPIFQSEVRANLRKLRCYSLIKDDMVIFDASAANKEQETTSGSDKESMFTSSLDSAWSEYTMSVEVVEVAEKCRETDFLSTLDEIDQSTNKILEKSKRALAMGQYVNESFMDTDCLCCVIS